MFNACSKHDVVTIEGQALGTYYRIKYLNIDYPKENFKKGIDSILNIINNSMSTYVSTSDISRINSGDSTIIINEHFEKVFQKSNIDNIKNNIC